LPEKGGPLQTTFANAKVLVSAEQIQKRVQELARKISQDYAGKQLTLICVLENGFIFAADLVRNLEVPVVCRFVRPEVKELAGSVPTTEIFFGPKLPVSGQHVLIVEALVQSGQTSDFLIRTVTSQGAASVKLATLLDKPTARRVALQPDYFGFLLDQSYAVGYGLGAPDLGRNLPYIAALPGPGLAQSQG
jgi:hypoxanthine phosphoribosyltransferase